MTCKVPPLHRSFSVHRVYLFFHLICIMYFLCIAHSDDSSFLYTSVCAYIYVFFIYIYICICVTCILTSWWFGQGCVLPATVVPTLVVWFGSLRGQESCEMGALSIFSELELSSLNWISQVPKKGTWEGKDFPLKGERERISSNAFLLYKNSAFLSSPLSCVWTCAGLKVNQQGRN